jgi:hypothetical protein
VPNGLVIPFSSDFLVGLDKIFHLRTSDLRCAGTVYGEEAFGRRARFAVKYNGRWG